MTDSPVTSTSPEQHARVDLLRVEPTAEAAARIEAASSAGGHVVVRGRAAHTFVSREAIDAATVPALGKLLGVSTNRNATVIRAIAERWC